jgi:hypothetical protein
MFNHCGASGHGQGEIRHTGLLVTHSHFFDENDRGYCSTCGSSEDDPHEVDFRVEKVWRAIGYEGFNDLGVVVSKGGNPGIRIHQNDAALSNPTHRYVLEKPDLTESGSPDMFNPGVDSIYNLQDIRWNAANVGMALPATNLTNFQEYDSDNLMLPFWQFGAGQYYLIGNNTPIVKFSTTSIANTLTVSYDSTSYGVGTGKQVKYHFIAINSNDIGYLYLGTEFDIYDNQVVDDKPLFSNLPNLSGYDKYVIPENHGKPTGYSFITGAGMVNPDAKIEYLFRLSIKVN